MVVRRYYKFRCGTCGDTTWVIKSADLLNAWRIECANGHRLVPTGGTEYVIEESEVSEVRPEDQAGTSDSTHPSRRSSPDYSSPVLSEEDGEDSLAGSQPSRDYEAGQGSRSVSIRDEHYQQLVVDLRTAQQRASAWEKEAETRRQNYNAEKQKLNAELHTARAERHKQHERANRSQNEAQQRVNELRRVRSQLETLRSEFDTNNTALEGRIHELASREARLRDQLQKMTESRDSYDQLYHNTLTDYQALVDETERFKKKKGIKELERRLENQKSSMESYQKELRELEVERNTARAIISDKDGTIASLRRTVNVLQGQGTVAQLDRIHNAIGPLKEALDELMLDE